MKGTETDESKPHCVKPRLYVAREGGRGRERCKERKRERVPSYDTSVQGHTKRRVPSRGLGWPYTLTWEPWLASRGGVGWPYVEGWVVT